MNRSLPVLAVAALSGIIFGIGLAISRMIDPEKVMNFLDFGAIPSGGWDPSLAFVMGGGLLVALVGMRLDRWAGMRAPLVAPAFIRPDRSQIDRELVIGSAIFGVGWGISGLCPGPAFADLSLIPTSVGLFVIAMLVGSWAAGQAVEWSAERRYPPAPIGVPAE
jgi:hypothetical protein